ncbi:MAG: hypothetical protein PHQ86_07990 [Dehalococcoidales bacterium]|nr:hypothetical protein [Dehalococcoidales bacterium]
MVKTKIYFSHYIWTVYNEYTNVNILSISENQVKVAIGNIIGEFKIDKQMYDNVVKYKEKSIVIRVDRQGHLFYITESNERDFVIKKEVRLKRVVVSNDIPNDVERIYISKRIDAYCDKDVVDSVKEDLAKYAKNIDLNCEEGNLAFSGYFYVNKIDYNFYDGEEMFERLGETE